MNTYFISDLHLGHEKITTFLNDDGERVRPFDNANHVHEYMIEKWNKKVKPNEHVYILGDVVIPRSALPVLDKLHGKKRLVLGNHDPYKVQDYLKHAERIYGVRVLDGAVLTHVPIHPGSLNDRTWRFNIHGHLHHRVVNLPDGTPDLRYLNVSCEQLDYTPLERQEVIEILRSRGLEDRYTLKGL